MNLLEQYLVTDRPYEIHTLNNGDLVANWAARMAMGQIRNAAASTSMNRTAFTGEDLELPKAMRIETGKIRFNSFRFLTNFPVHQQAWLLGKEELDILRVKCHEVKMRVVGSAVNEREWAMILYAYSFMQNDLVHIQDRAAES